MEQEINRPIRSALFVDFDNIYINLERMSPSAAQRFGTAPARWLKWIEDGMPTTEQEQAPLQRRNVLVRRCYLNPGRFQGFRPYFIHSAFSVIDCPLLTNQGKNSADIHMVMDILDTLEHRTHFDEFIILSGDSDFTPVLVRLRAHDRRTAILTAGPVVVAYRSASDRVISGEQFLEDALGLSAEQYREAFNGSRTYTSTSPDQLLDAIAQRLYEEASASGELLGTDITPILKEFPEFTSQTNWLGFFSLRRLTEELVGRRSELRFVDSDPWLVTIHTADREAADARSGRSHLSTSTADLRQRIVAVVRQVVHNSPEPVTLARAAHRVVRELGPQVLESRWAEAGTFKNLLQMMETHGMQITTLPHPGYLFDPSRHHLPDAELQNENELEQSSFEARVSQVTGTPNLSRDQYALLFETIADELASHPYNLTTTSKAVRDRCIERGQAISRASVSFILQGISYAGHPLSTGTPDENSAQLLASSFARNVQTLCQRAQLDLDSDEQVRLEEWIVGGLE